MTASMFQHRQYMIRRKVFKLFGGAFHIYDPSGSVAFFSKMKAFKLKEDIRLYTGEDMQTEVLRISTRQILDFGATYDVTDSQSGQRLGAFRRKGLKSIIRDEWLILDVNDQPAGTIKEDTGCLALVRRLLSNLVPQSFTLEMGGSLVGVFRQRFNPFVLKIDLDFTPDTGSLLDRRLGIAAAVLLGAIEGRQN